MKTVIVIPARYASSRYPGKPLVTLDQGDGTRKSLIQMTWEAAQGIEGVAGVYVATDDDRIAEASRAFGAEVVMTSDTCRNGTERVAEAVRGMDIDVAVNLQGDAPLTPPWFLTALIDAMKDGVQMATPVLKCDPQTYANFMEDRRAGRVGGTTAVFDHARDALYFSKEVIPYLPEAEKARPPVYHHVGVYAYTPAALAAYGGWSEGPLERLEGLEQLRFLENGHKVRCVEVEAQGRVFWELNNPEDVPRIEAVLRGER
ncbi:3-deoxy-manno-octulosonate cytidylyltransferase [Pseudaestuariivita atlantica]|uniref:3-deoxy-manno-octulosonate cytidylyltransferase n=1 Tax=Pseudaestuariivita atlantica TaxID=1317121 RepID=A0A0L1JNY9_9RHOB|nr:manno-octulosonate cytidylyltransferase [Pseudaestuariivita atlantica]KNG93474.1 3-deoxy-manno-octulosonate cytidylyltransferase [Pseudaestuariivita atlantica]